VIVEKVFAKDLLSRQSKAKCGHLLSANLSVTPKFSLKVFFQTLIRIPGIHTEAEKWKGRDHPKKQRVYEKQVPLVDPGTMCYCD